MKIFLDIETIPAGQEPIYTPEPFAGVKVPANYKNEDAIAKYTIDNQDKAIRAHVEEQAKKRDELLHEWKKGALKATRSQIVCICGVLSNDQEFRWSGNNEAQLLSGLEDMLLSFDDPLFFIGHNVKFDLQMLRTHAAKYGLNDLVEMLTFERFSKNIHDTMELWAGVRFDDKTKLTEIAEFLGIENLNGDTDGSDIYDLYKAGKFEEIQTKCFNDVLMCKQVYERIS